MATPEKAISDFALLASPSANATAFIYDPDEVLPENRTRLALLSTIGAARVFLVTGDPNGVIGADGPAIGITAQGFIWVRPVATAGNTGWFKAV